MSLKQYIIHVSSRFADTVKCSSSRRGACSVFSASIHSDVGKKRAVPRGKDHIKPFTSNPNNSGSGGNNSNKVRGKFNSNGSFITSNLPIPSANTNRVAGTTTGTTGASNSDVVKDRPFTLPSGDFRPKQSLGQNFLSDQNYVLKIVNELKDSSPGGCQVVEIGPGPGSLTRMLLPRYPNMTAIEIDQRAVAFLNTKLPSLDIKHQDVLTVDWSQLCQQKNGQLNIIANLPYHIVSQVLFCLADSHQSIKQAIVTTQYEVAQRLVAKPNSKDYGILSVVFQLYGSPTLNFKIPPTVFYPQPKVQSALVTIDFTCPHPQLPSVDLRCLKKVIHGAFRQRRKMMRASLKELLTSEGLVLPQKWHTLRPEQLQPHQFIELTIDLYGKKDDSIDISGRKPVWRDSKYNAVDADDDDDVDSDTDDD